MENLEKRAFYVRLTGIALGSNLKLNMKLGPTCQKETTLDVI